MAIFLSVDFGRDKGENPVKGFESLIKGFMTPGPIRKLISFWKDRHGNKTESYNII
jgi:hypothetical protein